MHRRKISALLLILGGLLGLAAPGAEAADGVVYKNPSCQCCSKWMSHMAERGYGLTATETAPGDLDRLKAGLGLKPGLSSCHTAMIEGYVIEGHVPAEDVDRLLAERPEAIGLSVPGMPPGSPGMETGGAAEPYDVLLIGRDGSATVFARH